MIDLPPGIGETGSLKLTAHDAHTELINSVIRKAWESSPLLISLYAVITFAGVGASYFTSRWSSVALSFAVALVTLLIGLGMVRKVIRITITKTIR
jgi:hypothetical protein